uniref:Uncharacterized protein n=1 Tax=Aegilops tauschii subsp. strangulata TaxID=200361 RepID=A0A453PK23_AEGTS
MGRMSAAGRRRAPGGAEVRGRGGHGFRAALVCLGTALVLDARMPRIWPSRMRAAAWMRVWRAALRCRGMAARPRVGHGRVVAGEARRGRAHGMARPARIWRAAGVSCSCSSAVAVQA